MTKEDLVKLGLDDATAQKVADASTEELKGFIPKTRFDEVNEAKKALDEQVKDRDKQLETLKKSTGDAAELQKKIEDLQTENKTAKADYESKIKQIQIDNAVESALVAAKAKNNKAVRALLDLEKAELDDSGVKGLVDQIKKLQETEDTKFLFDAADQQTFKGANPPGESSQKTPANKTLDQMTYSEMCAYMEANPGATI